MDLSDAFALLALTPSALVVPRYLRARADRRQRNIFSRWPIPSVSLTALDAIFQSGPLGASIETEVHFVGGAGAVRIPGATSDTEAWILSVLAKRAHLMFEFGTCTGRTAYLWARNSPSNARVVTITLRREDVTAYRRASGDNDNDVQHALDESAFDSFLYTNTCVADKVQQLFGDSKGLDESPWAAQCDLVFVDGSHAKSYVASDSAKALRLVRPGGVVLWHDYRGPRAAPGVYDALNELALQLPLVHIAGTSFVVYRRPLES
jgi:predicted O-methyltransferase YrrM